MGYEITGISKRGKRFRYLRPTISNAEILKKVMVDKGAKSVKIKDVGRVFESGKTSKEYTLYASAGGYVVEDAKNPANFQKPVCSLKGLPKKKKEEIIEFRSTTLKEKDLKKLEYCEAWRDLYR